MEISYILNKGAELIGKKWRAVVIWHLRDGPMRFSELKRKIPDVSVKVLSEVLQEMEQNGLLIRTQYNSIPVKVTYELNPEATDFIAANLLFTIKVGEYLAKNKDKTGIPEDVAKAINKFIKEYKDQGTL